MTNRAHDQAPEAAPTDARAPRVRFDIGSKTALLVIALVLAAALAAPQLLFKKTSGIVEEHEIVDLQDEASLRGWDIREMVTSLRRDIRLVATNQDLLAELRRSASDPWHVPLETGRRFPLRWRQFLKVVVVDPSGAPLAPDIVFRPGVEALRPPTNLLAAAFRAETLNFAPSSPLLTVTVPRMKVARDPPDRFLTPAVWVVTPGSASDGQLIGVLVALELTPSPRHIWFLMDTHGTFLAHPLPAGATGGPPAALLHGLDLATAFRTSAWQGVQSQVQRGSMCERTPLETTYFFLEGDPNPEFNRAIDARVATDRDQTAFELERFRADYFAQGYAVGGFSEKVRAIRMLARDPQRPEQIQRDVRRKLAEDFGALRHVQWRPTVACRHGDVQLIRVLLPGLVGDDTYWLAYAAFREELVSSVGSEFARLRLLAVLFALGAGLLAFAMASLIVHPLRHVTRTARAVTADTGEGLADKIEAVRRALPTRRHDEVGDIARALEQLLLQVLNGHARLRQLNADLEGRVHARTRELADANEQLKGLARAKDEFLANVSHELRQPLNSIFGFQQFLEMSDLTEEQRADLAKIRHAATYLRSLISDILDYQKITMGVLELETQDVPSAPLLAEVRDSVEALAAERGNRLVFDVAPDLGTLRNDRPRLQQILVNLLTNAAKFTQQGTITLRARREATAVGQDWLVLEVEDTGRGMKPEEQRNLFVKFKKLSAREGNKSGTGLGLVITKGLCELMGGDIRFASAFGKGTTFTVRIPARVGAAAEAPAPAPAAPPAGPGPARGGATAVLVIDDDPGARELMARFLGGNGYRVETAADADEGLARARALRPDVITLDAVMPGRDGWELLSALKSDPATAAIPVVMVTFREEQRRGFALGAADYIVKPVNWEHLRRVLDRLAGADAARPRGVLVIEDDPEARELFRRALAADGWEVQEAAHGQEGLDRLAAARPAAILLDLMMPVMDGFEFLAAYRERAAAAGETMAPILVVTAKDPTPEERQRLAGLVEGVLQKGSHTREDLLREILALVRSRVAAPPHGEPPWPAS